MFDWSDSKTWSKGEGFLGRRQRRRMFEWLLIRRHNRYAPLLLLLPSRPLASQLASWINIYILSPIQPCLLLASPAPLEASAPKLALILIYTHTRTHVVLFHPQGGSESALEMEMSSEKRRADISPFASCLFCVCLHFVTAAAAAPAFVRCVSVCVTLSCL